MKELFEKLKHVKEFNKGILIDTCFFFNIFKNCHDKKLKDFCEKNKCAITSFNTQEILHNDHNISDDIRHRIRKFISSNPNIVILDVDVHPGEWQNEKDFVNKENKDLLQIVKDPSDAVLIATAMKTSSNILTRDKHHIFNTKMENFLKEYDVIIYNNFY